MKNTKQLICSLIMLITLLALTGCGAAKPEARFFHAAAQAAGVTAADVLHVGDDAHLDVVGGLDAGMQVAWVNREAQDWPAQHPAHAPHATVADLGALVRLLNLQA